MYVYNTNSQWTCFGLRSIGTQGTVTVGCFFILFLSLLSLLSSSERTPEGMFLLLAPQSNLVVEPCGK
jgi:hypothetical protein